MAGASHALQGDGDRPRRADVADKVDRSNVDAEFERGGRDQDFYLAFFQLALGLETQLARQASVMCGDIFLAKALAELMGNAFGQAPGVDEDERRAVRLDELDDALVNLVPHFVRGNRAEFRGGNFNSEVKLPFMADINDDGIGARILGITWILRIRSAAEKMCHFFDWLLRRGKADTRRGTRSQLFEALQRERKMHAAFVVGNGVNFVDNHGLYIAQNGAALFRREQNVE